MKKYILSCLILFSTATSASAADKLCSVVRGDPGHPGTGERLFEERVQNKTFILYTDGNFRAYDDGDEMKTDKQYLMGEVQQRYAVVMGEDGQIRIASGQVIAASDKNLALYDERNGITVNCAD